MSEMNRMKELVDVLSEAAKAYYQEDKEIISNIEYDKLYDELLNIEKALGVILAGSPTSKVGYELLSELPKERHGTKMLSLDKTKDREALVLWIGEEKGLLSWKLDGLTIVLTYEDGVLVKGITRGNGEIGEVITNNVRVFDNIPLKIKASGTTVIRGEAVIKYSDFEKINEALEDEELYKNPRNLCSGTVRQLNNEVTANRHVNFFAFQLVSSEDVVSDSKIEQLNWLRGSGFDIVDFKEVSSANMIRQVEYFEDTITKNDFPSDGLVLTYDSLEYSISLGATSKFPRHSIAFKWQDEIKETKLIDVEWSASRTGRINPVAIFEPVDIEGTTVARASLHNISIVEELELGIGDTIEVYKANMIIPQLASNITKSGGVVIPSKCPVCDGATEIKDDHDVRALYCTNPLCSAKQVKAFAHYVSRDALNIEGMSEATIEKFIASGFLHNLSDIYKLEAYKETIETMDGFGEKSYVKLIKAIEASKEVRLENFIYALGILNVGVSNARLLCKKYAYDLDLILEAEVEELIDIEGYGEVIANSLYEYFHDEDRLAVLSDLRNYISFEAVEVNTNVQVLEGEVFVITGSLNHFENRKAMQARIELVGGKVTGSVTSKTTYLINNNVTSATGKNKKAKELDIPIISEEDFLKMI